MKLGGKLIIEGTLFFYPWVGEGGLRKAETSFHGCHSPGDMAVLMRKVLAGPWVGVECVTCFYCCFSERLPDALRAQCRLMFLSRGFALESPAQNTRASS